MQFVLAPALVGCLFVGMLALGEFGRRLGERRRERDPQGSPPGSGVVDGAVFALLGLLVAFTFSSAAARFDARRQLIVEEANAIGTAWLRLDVLPAEAREPLRDLFRSYLDSRLHVYANVDDVEATQRALAHSADLQSEIWRRSVAACERPDGQRAIVVLLPALNEMFDITTTRTMATRFHQPEIIFALLVGLGLICALLAGYSIGQGGRRSWAHLIGFAAVIAFTVYVIIDLEYPRRGLIRVDSRDEVLRELRASMD
jgi:hypothetical protein